MALVCKLCVGKYGLKGTDVGHRNLANDDALVEHLENFHGIPVRREGETEEQTMARCAAKGIVADETKCMCAECRINRGDATIEAELKLAKVV